MTEEDVKRIYITPSLEKAGWVGNLIKMEYSITAGKIIFRDNIAKRDRILKVDYLLLYKGTLPIAVVEAKDSSHIFGDGTHQAQNYASKLNIRFVFTSNGNGFLFYDMQTGEQKTLNNDEFPSPEKLYNLQFKTEEKNNQMLETIINTPYYFGEESYTPRYYQMLAVNKTVSAIANNIDKVLLVLATGTGKTYIAFQIIWRLWKASIKKRILYLADRNILIDQTIMGDFKPFKGNMTKIYPKIMNNDKTTSYEIYLSLYQQLSENDCEDPLETLKKNFKPDFFDLIIVDECHRGSAREDSNWRKILDYFTSAAKIGMTATPKETKEVSNSDYFGEPIYTYSLKDGIEDGFLAPYKVVRYALDSDVFGFRPEKGKRDKDGDLVEDREYGIKDFDKKLVIDERTQLVAQKITEYLKKTDRFAKTIIFCVDINHAERMRQALVKLNSDLCSVNYKYIMRITGDNDEGKKQLDNFIDNDSKYPTIVTTSKLMTTGVNCPTCKNIVLDNTFGDNGMTEFKQIIGRGTRIKEDYGKMYFSILDFKNATKLFADPNFNGLDEKDPNFVLIDNKTQIVLEQDEDNPPIHNPELDDDFQKKNKVYINGVNVEVLSERVQYYDKDGKLVTESLTDFTKKNFLNEFSTMDEFLNMWTKDEQREKIIEELQEHGILIEMLRNLYPKDVDDFDLLCDIAYGIKPLTKSARAKRTKVDEVLSQYSGKCLIVLKRLLDKYANNTVVDLWNLNVLKTNEFNDYGNPMKIVKLFGGRDAFMKAAKQVQNALYI